MTRSHHRIVDARYPHFLTATINHWLPVFTRPETVEIVLDSRRYWRHEAGFIRHGYVILENHLHCVARSDDLGRDIQRFKSYTARRILDHLKERKSSRLLELLADLKPP